MLSPTKLDLDETFTEASDGCCLKPNLTMPSQNKPNQTDIKSSLIQPKPSQILMKFSQKLQMYVVSNRTTPNQTLNFLSLFRVT